MLALVGLGVGCAATAAVRPETRAQQSRVEQEILAATPAEIDARMTRRFFAIMLDEVGGPRDATEGSQRGPDREATLLALRTAFEERVGMTPVEIVREAQRDATAKAAAKKGPSLSESLAVLAAIGRPNPDAPDRSDDAATRSLALLDSHLRAIAAPVLQAAGAPEASVVVEPAAGASARAVLITPDDGREPLPVPIVGVLVEGLVRMPSAFGVGLAAQIQVGPETILIAQSDDQLACLVGHELAHLLLGHPDAAIWIGHGTSLVGSIGEGAVEAVPVAGFLVNKLFPTREVFGDALVGMPVRVGGYDRAREFDADRMGQEIAAKAGFDPSACADLVLETARHARATAAAEGGAAALVAPYWSSHPPSTERILALREHAEELGGRNTGPAQPRGGADDEGRTSPAVEAAP